MSVYESECGNTDLDELDPAEFHALEQFLQVSESWRRLVESIEVPDDASKQGVTSKRTKQQNRIAVETFLREWATIGRHKPTLHDLLDLLIEVELYGAANYVSNNLLYERPRIRPCIEPVKNYIAPSIGSCGSEYDSIPDHEVESDEQSKASSTSGMNFGEMPTHSTIIKQEQSDSIGLKPDLKENTEMEMGGNNNLNNIFPGTMLNSERFKRPDDYIQNCFDAYKSEIEANNNGTHEEEPNTVKEINKENDKSYYTDDVNFFSDEYFKVRYCDKIGYKLFFAENEEERKSANHNIINI